MGNPIDLLAPGRLRVGVNRQSTADMGIRAVAENDARGENYFEQYSADALGPDLVLGKSRGTAAAPGNVAQNDQLGVLQFQGMSTTRFQTASIESYVDAAVVAGQRPASRLELRTNVNNTAPALRAYVSKEGNFGIGPFAPSAGAAQSAAYPLHVVASGSGAELYATLENYDAANNATYRMGRARGTLAAPGTIVTGDILGELEFFGYTNQWHHCAEITSSAEGVIVAGVVPDSNLQFTTTTAGALNICGTFFSTGRLALGAASTQSLATSNANGKGALWLGFNDASDPLCLHRASANSGSAAVYFRKSRGTLAAPASVATDDELMYLQGSAYTNAWVDNVGAIALYVDGAVVAGQRPGNRLEFRTGQSGDGGPTSRMKVLAGGTIFIGDAGATADTSRTLHVRHDVAGSAIFLLENVQNSTTGAAMHIRFGSNSAGGADAIFFSRPDGTNIGLIEQATSTTITYNTSSDERLKENIADLGAAEGVQLISALRPRAFNFKGDKTALKGFIAQEVYSVLPHVVHVGGGQACACDLSPEGEGKHAEDCCYRTPWSMDYGMLTPILVKAVQELDRRLAAMGG